MSALQGVIFVTFDINTKEIEFIRNDNITDYDTNVTNIYVQSKYKNSSGETIYLSADEITNYNFSLYTIKPLTNTVKEITGVITDELTEQVFGGVIKFVIPKTCTNRVGIVKCELHINKEKEMIASTRFIFNVKQSLVTEIDESLLKDSDFPVLQQLILEIQKASNIDDNNRSKIASYSSDKVETIKEDLSSQIKDIENRGYTKYPMPIQGRVFGHRGVNGYAPENTLVGIQTAHQLGYKSIEVDVIKTKDDHWILMHDGTVDRTTNGTGWVKDLTLEKIQALKIDSGSFLERFNQEDLRVPTVEEILREIKKLDMTVMLEVKGDITQAHAQGLVDLVKKEGCLDRVIFSCYLRPDKLRMLRKADPSVWLDYTPSTFNLEAINVMKEVYPCTVDLDGTLANTKIAEEVELAQNNGIEVLAWTVDDLDRIKYLLSLGVKSVITNKSFVGGGK